MLFWTYLVIFPSVFHYFQDVVFNIMDVVSNICLQGMLVGTCCLEHMLAWTCWFEHLISKVLRLAGGVGKKVIKTIIKTKKSEKTQHNDLQLFESAFNDATHCFEQKGSQNLSPPSTSCILLLHFVPTAWELFLTAAERSAADASKNWFQTHGVGFWNNSNP